MGSDYLIRAADNPEPECSMAHLDFRVHEMKCGSSLAGETGENEVGITILYGTCGVSVDGVRMEGLGERDAIKPGCSPPVCLVPPGSAYEVAAATDAKLTVSRTKAGGGLRSTAIIPAGLTAGVKRGNGKTERTIYDLIPEDVNTKLMIYEIFTPEGNWSSFPPHKHDEEREDESLLEEVYLFHFDPPGGFALVWLFDDEGELDLAWAVKNGDLELIPKGYHTMAVSPGYLCSTHAVMAGPTNEWKIKFKEEYRHLYDWDK